MTGVRRCSTLVGNGADPPREAGPAQGWNPSGPRQRRFLDEAATGGEELASMSDATTIDLHEVAMAMSCPREAITGPATFSLFVRDLPSDQGFLASAGLESALDFLSGFRIGAEDVDTFAAAPHHPPTRRRGRAARP
jgi:hypothetical protein